MRVVVQRWMFPGVMCVLSALFASPVPAQSTTLPATAPSTQSEPRKTVKLLTVGNSFAFNSTRYLTGIAKAAGNRLVMTGANNSGLSLQQHWAAVEAFEKNPNDPAGRLYPTTAGQPKAALGELLEKDRWDYITMQQASYWSDKPESYHPYAERLYAYIKGRAPQAEVVIHQTWAYRQDHERFKDGKSSPKTMHEAARAAYHAVAKQLKLRVIPVGDAMFAAMSSPERPYMPDNTFDFAKAVYPALPAEVNAFHVGWNWAKNKDGVRQLKLDGGHASAMGCYLGACVFYEFLFEEDVTGNAFVPAGLKPEDTAFLQKLAHGTMAATRGTMDAVGAR